MNAALQQQPLRLITTKEFLDRAGMSRTTLWEKRQEDPDCPKPVNIGKGTGRRAAIRWVEHEVDEWIRKLIATRE